MSEQIPGPEPTEDRFQLRRFYDLPHYYQCLGKACAAAGILDEFYSVVDAGFDYGQAVSVLRHDLETSLDATNVDVWLEHHGIPNHFEEPEVE